MEINKKINEIKLFVTDIDNTVFDWVSYYVPSMQSLFEELSRIINVSVDQLAEEAKQVFSKHGSIEYPFLVQELESVIKYYGADIDGMLATVDRCRSKFMDVGKSVLKPYSGVIDTFVALKQKFPDMPIVALTDAPRYVAMWKLNKLGLLQYFDAVYGLADPTIPTSNEHGRIKVDPEILYKHLGKNNFGFQGKVRILPDEYEKPGTKGLKMVLIDYEMDERHINRENILWCGDNVKKDIKLGKSLGVKTVWARYGVNINQSYLPQLSKFSPPLNVHKNLQIDPGGTEEYTPDAVIDNFSDILKLLS